MTQEVDWHQWDDATPEDIDAVCHRMFGSDLRTVLGSAYGEVESFVVEAFIGIDHPSHDATLQKLKAQFGEDRAAELALAMTLTVQAQARAHRA